MPASPIDLTTLPAVRDLLQDSESVPDETVQVMITSASRAILNYTGRELVKGPDGEARDFLARGSFLDLGSKDLRSAAAVTLYTDREESQQVLLGESEYKLRPIQPEFGVYEWLELPDYLSGETQVTIEGGWGFPEVPEDVAYWCGMTVVIWARSDISAFSTTFSIDEGRIEKPTNLPPAVRANLDHYQRVTVR